MADVIKIAKERRVRLAAELAKLDDFVRMAEALVEWSQSKAGKASGIEDETGAGLSDAATVPSYSSAAGTTAKN